MKKILIIAPHPDDEIIGCGGTIIKNISEGNEVYVCIVTKGRPPLFKPEGTEKVQKEARECHSLIGIKDTFFLDLPSSMLEQVPRYELNEKLLGIVLSVKPDVVFIPHIGDMQKDHQMVVEAAMVALRPKYSHKVGKIYAYETMSETGWNIPNIQNEFIPNVFVDISDYLDRKLEALSVYTTQIHDFPDARSIEAIKSLAKYRGALMHYWAAESFMLIRELL